MSEANQPSSEIPFQTTTQEAARLERETTNDRCNSERLQAPIIFSQGPLSKAGSRKLSELKCGELSSQGPRINANTVCIHGNQISNIGEKCRLALSTTSNDNVEAHFSS